MQLKKIFTAIGDTKVSLGGWFITLFGIVVIRTFFEYIFESSHLIMPMGNFYDSIVDLLHIGLSWICVYLSILLVINLFDKKRIEQTAKITLAFLPVIIIVPLLDWFIFGSGKILYENNFHDFWYKYFHLFDISKDTIPRVTNGIRVEIALVVIGVTTYIYTLRKNLLLAITASISVYSVIYFYGYLPASVNWLFSTTYNEIVSKSILPIQSNINLNFYTYIPIFFLLTIFAVMKLHKQYRYMITDSLRIERFSIYFGLLLFGFIVGIKHSLIGSEIYNFYDISKFFDAASALLFSFIFATVLNNIYDIDIDKISNTSRALIKYNLPLDLYNEYKNISLFFALFFAVGVNWEFWFLIVNIVALSYVYSAPFFRLKRFFIISNIILALIATLVFLSGFCIVESNGAFINISKEYLGVVFVFFFVASHFKDIKDSDADSKFGIITFPILAGKKRSFIWLKIFVGILLIAIFYIFNIGYLYAAFLTLIYLFCSYKISDSENFLIALELLVAAVYVLYWLKGEY